ncbi:family 20 glycosylhydrolase [Sphingomonas piscis]|uniref:beta-N-acetylhexosaminidase n=2 Tax=Sphingomonas piscis TaxID=2714943 RepID=A0A6G7YTB3_9SPHN|nr:family 20 glycosylhydrolase [Sphingomonas piscis]
MGVRLTIVDNRPPTCPQQASGCFLSHLDLTMPRTVPSDIAAGRFKLYFSSVSPVIEGVSNAFEVRHLNGDLHVIEPRADVHLAGGATYRLQLWTGGHFFSAYYPMPNMFVASGTLQARVIDATKPRIDPASGMELLPFVAPMTDEQRLATAGPNDDTRWLTADRAFDLYASRGAATSPDIAIIPTPIFVSRPGGQPVDLRGGVTLRLAGLQRSDVAAALDRLSDDGVPSFERGPDLRIRVGAADLKADAYRLRAADGAIQIEAATPAGAANALQSLAQQVAFEKGMLRPLVIDDESRLPFRGLHLDLARNFHSKGQVLKLIDRMAVYKLNKLHLHLGDDEGWRLQIGRFPELTEVGGFRCFDPAEDRCLLPQLGSGPDRDAAVNGFLTQADYREILQAAKARHIEVIPSFDMPGHSRAAIRSMEARYRRLMRMGQRAEAERFRLVEPADRTKYSSVQHYSDNTLNVCLESTYRFLDEVIDDVVAMHAAAGTPLKTYHIGADETAGAWTNSPACKKVMAATRRTAPQLGAMFIEKVSASLARRGIAVGGWSDGMGHVDPAKMPAKVQSNIWSDLFTAAPAETADHAGRGWDAVISVPTVLYFDVPYAPHPLERGYDWPTRGTDTFKVFSFMPESLAANAAVMKNSRNQAVTVTAPAVIPRIAGMQAQLWSETVRSDALVDQMLFPRLLAFAERAWHRAPWEVVSKPGATYGYGDKDVGAALRQDWAAFAGKLPFHLAQLSVAGIQYRLAPPGARVTGMLEANSELPGTPIEYRVHGGQWQTYLRPIPVSSSVQLRTTTPLGDRSSRIVEAVRP